MAHTTVDGHGHGNITLGSYLAGFILAILLTGLAFGLVMSGVLSQSTTVYVIFAAAAVQVLVHLRYFLHLDGSAEQRWNLSAIVFTALIVAFVVGGTVWIMFNLYYRTMDPFSVCSPGHWIPQPF